MPGKRRGRLQGPKTIISSSASFPGQVYSRETGGGERASGGVAAEPVTPRPPSWSHSPSQVFSDIGAIQSLKRLVSYSTNGTTSALAKRALRLLGEEVPRPIVPCVGSWKEAEVQTWLQQIGFAQYCDSFRVRALPRHVACPGDALLGGLSRHYTPIMASGGGKPGLHSCLRSLTWGPPSHLRFPPFCSVLGKTGLGSGAPPDLSPFLQEQQVDGDLLLRLTDEELQTDLGMKSGITRKRYLFPSGVSSTTLSSPQRALSLGYRFIID